MTDITINLQSFLTSFGATTLETAKDEGLISLDICKNKILEVLKQNIENYQNNN